jgi:hypothetical protein
MNISQLDIHKLIDSICEGKAPTMFRAICTWCGVPRIFENGICESCDELWKPIKDSMEGKTQ